MVSLCFSHQEPSIHMQDDLLGSPRDLDLRSNFDVNLSRFMARSHLHNARPAHEKKSFILASALSFAGCASAFVARSSSTLGQRYLFVVIRCVRRTFCACSKLCAELDA